MIIKFNQIRAYCFPAILLFSILAGGLAGHILGPDAVRLKPLGDIFLNLIFTAIVPLVFFSVASSLSQLGGSKHFLKIMSYMMMTFILTGITAAVYMIVIVKLFPPGHDVLIKLVMPEKLNNIDIANQIVNIFTVSDFSKILSHQNMLALIFFSILVGLATSMSGEKGKSFSVFLQSGTDVFMKIISLIMYYAPIGFFAYFAVLVSELGPKIMESYFRVTVIYYGSSLVYFVLAFTLYAYLAGKKESIKLFWKNMLIPMLTSLATCSSAASIPANLHATKKMGVPIYISEAVIPLGTIIHKQGSILGAIIKIAFLFGIFHMSFSGPIVLLTALIIAMLVGTVMGAIPSGGMLGEMLILSLYGFPPQALIIIAAISVIIDPLATMLNVLGNTVCSMLIARFVAGRDWLKNQYQIFMPEARPALRSERIYS